MTEKNIESYVHFRELLSHGLRKDSPELIQKLRLLGLNALITGLNAALPHEMIHSKVILTKTYLEFCHERIPRKSFSNIVFVGGGKATAQMCQCIIDVIGDQIPFSGAINIPKGQNVPIKLLSPSKKFCIEITFASHPVPDEDGIKGVQKMRDIIVNSPQETLIIALISGGGSALMPCPAEGISLADKQAVNKLLLQCGAEIHEINAVRKHLSKFKGGQLSTFAIPRRVVSLILSDVIGNDLQTIASGPTVPDLTSFEKVMNICKKYQIFDKMPVSVQQRIREGVAGIIPETPKPDPKLFDYTTNIIIGSAETSAEEIEAKLKTEKIPCEIFSNELSGEARDYGKKLVDLLSKFQITSYPSVFIGTGEFTVTIKGKGKGGRNQEMLLSVLDELSTNPEYSTNEMEFVIISGAFDGIEGNSPAMGAIIDSDSLNRIQKMNLNIQEYLENNNSYAFFDKLGDALITGQTGTNVNDMTLIIFGRK